MNQELSICQLERVTSLIEKHLEGLSEWTSGEHDEEYREYSEINKTLNELMNVKISVNKRDVVEIHGYVDQLISNDNGGFDNFGSSYLLVPREWALNVVIEQGFKDLEDFFSSYTYDDTMDLIDLAIQDGVLLGTGTGLQPHFLDGGN